MTSNRDFNNLDLAGVIEERVAPIIEQVINGYGLAGLALGIVRNGKIVYAQGHGKRNLASGEPVTARSLFHMASVSKTSVSKTSVSKTSVSTAIMQLWEGGHLDLDASVTSYLPYLELKGENRDRITLAQLLSHTGGVPDTDDYGWHRPEFDDGALERYVRSLKDESMIGVPGERYAYGRTPTKNFEKLGVDNRLRPCYSRFYPFR